MTADRLSDDEMAAMYLDRARVHVSVARECLHCGTPGRRCPEYLAAATWLVTHGHLLPPYVPPEVAPQSVEPIGGDS